MGATTATASAAMGERPILHGRIYNAGKSRHCALN